MSAESSVDAALARVRERSELPAGVRRAIEEWLLSPRYAAHREELVALVAAGEWEELEDAFTGLIPFGTGGRRGPTGPGPNRMNLRTIGESAQGLARYLLEQDAEAAARGVVVAHDTRLTSERFAEQTARVLAGNGLKVYLFTSPRATPELSFAVRHLGAAAGVVISASHNPPRDNGFKAYWEDGGQVVPPHDRGIIEAVQQVGELRQLPLSEAKEQGLLVPVGAEIDRAYQAAVLAQSLTSDRRLHIVYTPLHGTGITSVYPILNEAGFSRVDLVESQSRPDGSFPNVADHFPNPELPAALDELIAEVARSGAALGLATDPDADRVAVVVRAADGEVVRLNGNQVAALLCEHVLSRLRADGALPACGVVAETLVTTPLVRRIAEAHGARCVDNLLVGFKYIGQVIRELEDERCFLFGCEESLGYLAGTYARDKDGAVGALLISELAAALQGEGRTLLDLLDELYLRHGFHHETQRSLYVHGQEGLARIREIMRTYRESPPERLGERRIVRIIDRQDGRILDAASGKLLGQ